MDETCGCGYCNYCGQHQYKDRTTNINTIDIPIEFILSKSNQKNLIIQKNGQGRLYYRVGLNYVPTNLQLNSVNYGFKTERTYVAIDNSSHVEKRRDVIWPQVEKSDDFVLFLYRKFRRVSSFNESFDYLPAGCEIINKELKGTLIGDTNSLISWIEHRNLCDERVEAFNSLLWPDIYQCTYTIRTTSSGIFIIPSARAEEMYSPENFGRCATENVIIK
ncbi:hypothetical protein I4U23_005368 [Adineta vaga]|nr:hypothetical protein I4U23_005368 [Adineta vaga]